MSFYAEACLSTPFQTYVSFSVKNLMKQIFCKDFLFHRGNAKFFHQKIVHFNETSLMKT